MMKNFLSLFVASSLLLSAFGPGAASAAMVVRTAPASSAAPLTAPMALPGGGISGSAIQLSPTLAAPALGTSLPLPSAPALRAGLHAAPAALIQSAAPITGRPVASAAAVRIRPLTNSPSLRSAVQAVKTRRTGPAKTPFARTMRALSEKGPDFKKMGAADSRAAAGSDFRARIGADPEAAAVSAADETGDIELIVMAREGSGRRITQDVYPASLNPGMSAQSMQMALANQFGRLGISDTLLKAHDASPIGTVAKINAAVIRVPSGNAQSLMNVLQGMNLEVQVGRRFSIPQPQAASPAARTVGLKETAKVVRADKLQDELKKVLGEPTPPPPPADEPEASGTETGVLASFVKAVRSAFRRAFHNAAANPVLPWAILDSFAWVDHPYMKGRFLKSVDNENDGQTHGTHTASTVVGMDIFNFHGRNYNIFPKGSATESDILFKLNLAQKDGALATTHSWGDGRGNPEGAIEKLFTKMAEEGVHHSISAGNSGYYGKNRIGGPAIAVHEAELVLNGKVVGKTKRIKAIAASDADKKTASFSSRGPGSYTTSRDPKYKDWPQKPDESGVGVNLVAAAPPGQGSENAEMGGPAMSMSGTSMSNPGVFGAFLLLSRGILVLLADQLPKLPQKELTQLAMDLARYSMTHTALKVASADEVGDGFIDVWAAFEFAGKTLKENAPAPERREMSMREFFVINALGVAGSIAAGFWMQAPLLGILGTFIAPVPLLFAYVGLMRLLGYRLGWPKVRFDPSVSFAGRQHHLLKQKR